VDAAASEDAAMSTRQFMARVKLGRRPAKNGTYHGSTRQLTVPAAVATRLPDGATFDIYLTDEGLLYKFVVAGAARPDEIDMPAWLLPDDELTRDRHA
jgi:hypothetical protein